MKSANVIIKVYSHLISAGKVEEVKGRVMLIDDRGGDGEG